MKTLYHNQVAVDRTQLSGIISRKTVPFSDGFRVVFVDICTTARRSGLKSRTVFPTGSTLNRIERELSFEGGKSSWKIGTLRKKKCYTKKWSHTHFPIEWERERMLKVSGERESGKQIDSGRRVWVEWSSMSRRFSANLCWLGKWDRVKWVLWL